VNYPTLTDGASCESSQPLRETFVLRSAVCRRSSLWGWPVHLAFCDRKPQFQHHTIRIRQILFYLYLRGYPRWLATVRILAPQGLHLLPSYRESCIPAFLPIFITTTRCKNYKNLAAFIPHLSEGDFPPFKLKIRF